MPWQRLIENAVGELSNFSFNNMGELTAVYVAGKEWKSSCVAHKSFVQNQLLSCLVL